MGTWRAASVLLFRLGCLDAGAASKCCHLGIFSKIYFEVNGQLTTIHIRQPEIFLKRGWAANKLNCRPSTLNGPSKGRGHLTSPGYLNCDNRLRIIKKKKKIEKVNKIRKLKKIRKISQKKNRKLKKLLYFYSRIKEMIVQN